jgi:hypothetical protein
LRQIAAIARSTSADRAASDRSPSSSAQRSVGADHGSRRAPRRLCDTTASKPGRAGPAGRRPDPRASSLYGAPQDFGLGTLGIGPPDAAGWRLDKSGI